MKATPQTKTQNVHEHGLAVWEKTKALISGKWDGMRIPDWFRARHVEIVNNLYPASTIKQYNVFHDCGKPFCIEYDDRGRKHFPDHANVSADTYLQFFDDPGNIVSDLIRDDMVLHTATADEIAAKDWSKRHALTLLVTALAELHANADMFGGIESNSFKAKWKKVNRRGKQLVNRYLSDQYKKHSYVIVRNDLTKPQQAVQATHVGIELGRTEEELVHPSIVAVVVKNENKLKRTIAELLEQGITCKIFRDNVYEEEITAVITEPLDPDQRQALRRYQLLQ